MSRTTFSGPVISEAGFEATGVLKGATATISGIANIATVEGTKVEADKFYVGSVGMNVLVKEVTTAPSTNTAVHNFGVTVLGAVAAIRGSAFDATAPAILKVAFNASLVTVTAYDKDLAAPDTAATITIIAVRQVA